MEKITQWWQTGQRCSGRVLSRSRELGPGPRGTKAVGPEGGCGGRVAQWGEHKVRGSEPPCEPQAGFPQAGRSGACSSL